MKKIFLIAFTAIFSITAFAFSTSSLKMETVASRLVKPAPLKKIDITVQSGSYTIHIVGTVNYSLNGTVTINTTITITGGGATMSFPFNYSGPLNSAKGTNKNVYSEKGIIEEDRQAVSVIVSHIYLPAEVNVKNVKVE